MHTELVAAATHTAGGASSAPPTGPSIGPRDAVLVKGSRVAGLEQLVALLLA